MTNILYSFRRCPYAMRARMALSLAGTDYEHREVLLRDKPEHLLEISPKGSVPVLLANGHIIDESLDIMSWALPDVEFKTDIIQMIDGPFKHNLDRYKYASRYDSNLKRGDIDLSYRALAVKNLQMIEAGLVDHPYLAGQLMGPTDIASFPFVRQFAAVEPDWWAVAPELSMTRAWLARCITSELFENIMQKFPIWSPQN